MCPQPRVKRQIDFFGQKQAINGTTPETLTVATREGIMLLFSFGQTDGYRGEPVHSQGDITFVVNTQGKVG